MSRRVAIVVLSSMGMLGVLSPAWAEEVRVMQSTPAASAVIAARSSELPAGDYKLHWAVRTMTKAELIQGDIPYTVKDQP